MMCDIGGSTAELAGIVISRKCDKPLLLIIRVAVRIIAKIRKHGVMAQLVDSVSTKRVDQPSGEEKTYEPDNAQEYRYNCH